MTTWYQWWDEFKALSEGTPVHPEPAQSTYFKQTYFDNGVHPDRAVDAELSLQDFTDIADRPMAEDG